MNKTLLLTLFASTLLLSACGTTPTTKENPENTLTFASGTSTSDYNYTRQMAKPTITEMTNREAMNSGFQKERSTDFLVEKEFADTYQQSCHRNGDPNDWDTPHLTDGEFTKDIQVSDVVSGNTLTLTGLRHSEQLLNLTPQQQQQVASRGRTLVGIDTLHNHYKMNYERASADQDSYDEERVQLSSTI
jgi:Spy/CpxP family protein refolding chaperone